jgi:hypothetical protein
MFFQCHSVKDLKKNICYERKIGIFSACHVFLLSLILIQYHSLKELKLDFFKSLKLHRKAYFWIFEEKNCIVNQQMWPTETHIRRHKFFFPKLLWAILLLMKMAKYS